MTRDWARYWRSPDRPLEAMHAHFERHVYHRHSHETYSFGVTENGAQSFTCRGSAHTSAAGMVMAFNPDDPHDGHPGTETGFTYRIVHIGMDLVSDVLADVAGRPCGLPLFADPVLRDPVLAGELRDLHAALLGRETALQRDELVAAAVTAMARRAAVRAPRPPSQLRAPETRRIAERARELLHDAYRQNVTASDLAAAAGCRRYALYRAFHEMYGLAPSDYQRQLRLRSARTLLSQGRPVADVAAEVGFADQSHLTRWFTRCFGIPPAVYRRGATHPGRAARVLLAGPD